MAYTQDYISLFVECNKFPHYFAFLIFKFLIPFDNIDEMFWKHSSDEKVIWSY